MAVRLAEEWFAICGGCEVTILDIGEPLLDVLKQVQIVHMPVLMDHKLLGQTGEGAELEIPEAEVGMLAGGIRTPIGEADRIKREEVWWPSELGEQERSIEIPCVGDRPPRSVLAREVAEILDARAQELLSLLKRDLERAALLNAIPAGLVFVGGGARLQGLLDMTEETFALPARVGRPRGLAGLPEEAIAPEYSAIVGLALYGARAQQVIEERPTFSSRLKGLFLG